MLDKPDLKKIWGDLGWNDETTTVLRQKIKKKLKAGIDINTISKRVMMVRYDVPEVEDYTLYDLAIEARMKAQKQNATHWFAVMSMLRGLGAKPACQIISEMTSVEKEKNRLDSIDILRNFLEQKKFTCMRKITLLPFPFRPHQRN